MNQYQSLGWPTFGPFNPNQQPGTLGPQTPLFGPEQGQPVSNAPLPGGQSVAGYTASQAGTAVQQTISNAAPGWAAAQRFFTWFSNADHWKGVGLILAAGVLGIVGLVLWTGKGSDAVKVSTTTGARIDTA